MLRTKFTFFFCIVCSILYSQNLVVLNGVIKDEQTNTPLSYANVLAKDTSGVDTKKHFCLTNDKGEYNLQLFKDLPYILEITYLGYKSRNIIVKLEEKINLRDYLLRQDYNILDEVVIKDILPPVIYKKDTIFYNVKSFSNGTERKLKELLRLLPFVEVDEHNNVYVEGKKVSKVLVEDQFFFGGSSELAVKSIPANAVKTVEVHKEYNKIPFMKNVSDENELTLNVKLKEGKKRFLFGQIKGGGGAKDRYELGSELFYYGGKYNFYSLGGRNNVNTELLSLKQFMQLKGGGLKMLSGEGGVFNQANLLFDSFLTGENFENRSSLGSLGMDYKLNSKSQLNTYAIYTNGKKRSKSILLNKYILSENELIENRLENEFNRTNFFTSNISLTHRNNDKNFFNLTLDYTTTSSKRNIDIFSTVIDSSEILTTSRNNYKEFNSSFNWDNKISERHINKFVIGYNSITQEKPIKLEDEHIYFNKYMSWVEDYSYVLQQNNNRNNSNLFSRFQHYCIINKQNHISATISNSYNISTNLGNVVQKLSDNSIVNLVNYFPSYKEKTSFVSSYANLNFRHKNRRTEIGIKTSFHYVKRLMNNIGPQVNYIFATPSLKIKTKTRIFGDINFNYSFDRKLPKITDIISRNIIFNFNTIKKGNNELDLESSHIVTFGMIKSNVFQRHIFRLLGSIDLQTRSIRSKFTNDGIENIIQPYMSNKLNYIFKLGASYTKEYNKLKLSAFFGFNSTTLERNINDDIVIADRYTVNPRFNIAYKLSQKSKITFNYKINKFWFVQKHNTTQNLITRLDLSGKIAIGKSIICRPEYNIFSSRNISSSNLVNIGLEYHKENSPFYFLINIHNLINNKSISSNSTTDLLISNSEEYIFPRYFLATITYDL